MTDTPVAAKDVTDTPVFANALERTLSKRSALYDADGDGKLSPIEEICKKYDTDGDGTFSIQEVKEIVRDMDSAKNQAKNMGRLAAAVAIVAICLCGALLGLMFAANEASKEGHVKGAVSVDLNGNPVESKSLQSFGSLLTFPEMSASMLNQLDFVSFSVVDDTGEAIDMRFRVSAWTRKQTSKDTTLVTQDGAKITIQGNGASASVTYDLVTYAVTVPDGQRRRLLATEKYSEPKLFNSMGELEKHYTSLESEEHRRLFGFGGMMTSGSFCLMSSGF
jgi:hypothetical protein